MHSRRPPYSHRTEDMLGGRRIVIHMQESEFVQWFLRTFLEGERAGPPSPTDSTLTPSTRDGPSAMIIGPRSLITNPVYRSEYVWPPSLVARKWSRARRPARPFPGPHLPLIAHA